MNHILNQDASGFYHMIYHTEICNSNLARTKYSKNITKKTFQRIWRYLYRKSNIKAWERFEESVRSLGLFSPKMIKDV